MIGGFEPHIWNITNDIITIKLSLKPKIIYIYIYILVYFTFKNIFAHPAHRSTQLKTEQQHILAHAFPFICFSLF